MILVSLLNPLRYKLNGYTDTYNTKYFDLFHYTETIREFEEQADYFQPFCKSDPLVNQVIGDVLSTITLNIYDCSSKLVLTEDFTKVFNVTFPNSTVFGVFQLSVDLSTLSEGAYYVQVTDGTTTIESNKIDLKTSHPGTVLIKYRNHKFYQDAIFEKDEDFYFYFRVQGYVKRNLPKKSSTTYEDQILNTTLLKYIPYNSWSYITDASGIPEYMSDILNNVFGCSFLEIDGRQFTIPQDSDWEEKTEDDYPLTGYGIDMREKTVNTSLSYAGTTPGGGDVITIHDIDADWWTTTPSSYIVPLSATGYKGLTVSQIYRPLIIVRSGNPYNIVDTAPGNGEVQFDDSVGIVFNSTEPFNPGERVTSMFEKV